MIRLFLIVLILCSHLVAKLFYLMPEEGARAEQAIEQSIQSARSEIVLTLYTFTNKRLYKALKAAAARDVKILLIVDGKNLKSNLHYAKAPQLAKLKNVTVRVASGEKAENGRYHGLMHLKVAVIDQKTVIHGSANWSHSAFSLNHELLFIEENNPHLAKALLAALEPLIKGAKPY